MIVKQGEHTYWHIGWFRKNDYDKSVPHGWGIGNLFTGKEHEEKEGWYEDKEEEDYVDGFITNNFKEDGDVSYEKDDKASKKEL